MPIFVSLVPQFEPQYHDGCANNLGQRIASEPSNVDILGVQILGLKGGPVFGKSGKKNIVPTAHSVRKDRGQNWVCLPCPAFVGYLF